MLTDRDTPTAPSTGCRPHETSPARASTTRRCSCEDGPRFADQPTNPPVENLPGAAAVWPPRGSPQRAAPDRLSRCACRFDRRRWDRRTGSRAALERRECLWSLFAAAAAECGRSAALRLAETLQIRRAAA